MVRSPVATSESGLPSVRREDLENAIFLDPPFVPVKIVYTAWSQCFYHFSGISIWRVLIVISCANTE